MWRVEIHKRLSQLLELSKKELYLLVGEHLLVLLRLGSFHDEVSRLILDLQLAEPLLFVLLPLLFLFPFLGYLFFLEPRRFSFF